MTLVVALLAAAPASAQQLAGGSAPDISIVRVLAALIVCIGAAFGLITALRLRKNMPALPRFNIAALGFDKAARIEVIEARRISLHADICLVRHDGMEYLLLCGTAGNQVLNSRPVADDPIGDDDAAL